MIRISVDEYTLLSTRVATSPMWEAVSSLSLLARYRSEIPHPYADWGRNAHRRVPRATYERLIDWMRPLARVGVPSFLAPAPMVPFPSMRDELSALRRTPQQVIARDLARLYPAETPASLAQLADPGNVSLLADCLESYWQAALEPYWPMMRNVLEDEVLERGRTLATKGPEAMLKALRGRMGWDRPYVSLPHHVDAEWTLRRTQLFIVPVLFARGARIFCSGRGGVAAISYQAHGASAFMGKQQGPTTQRADQQAGDWLATMIGKGRAAVLRALRVPTTTTDLADSIGLAPSTVSQHLSTLTAAGLVRRQRAGIHVLYELDRGGSVLLGELDRSGA